MSPAIGLSAFEPRPFGPANVTPAVRIGLVYLIIIAFFNFTFFSMQYSTKERAAHPVEYKFTSIRSVYKKQKELRGVLTELSIAIATFSHSKPSADIPRKLVIQ